MHCVHDPSHITSLVGPSSPHFVMNSAFVAENLAAALLLGEWTGRGLLDSALRVVRYREPWLHRFLRRLRRAFPEPPARQEFRALVDWISNDRGFLNRSLDGVFEFVSLTPAMSQSRWPVPQLATVGTLAQWLELTPRELDWFADGQGREAVQPRGPLRHYVYKAIPKRGGRLRLIESPKSRLKAIQRRILDQILSVIPAHDAAHGFCRGRSVVTYAAAHANKDVVLRLDLADFFPSVPASRVHAIFCTAGYPKDVARMLTGICTNVTPRDELPESFGADNRGWTLLQRLLSPHLPQGAPTSPALANLSAYRLDLRLSALAQASGIAFTRYADDLAFSGDEEFARGVLRFYEKACQIVIEEGFAVRPAKTRIMRRGVRQQLAGVVVNVRPNAPRGEYDRLKAILTNCSRHGVGSQNREKHPSFREHLLGRITWLTSLHPERGKKLRARFDRIDWNGG